MPTTTGVQTAYAEDLIPGARNAIQTCLRVRPDEHVTLVTDRRTEDIAASLADQAREVGASVEMHVMEDYGTRPMLTLPDAIAAALERADVSIYAGQPLEGELAFRRALTAIIDRRQIRHAHMVSISHRIMVEAMRANFDEVDAISTRVLARARRASPWDPGAGGWASGTWDSDARSPANLKPKKPMKKPAWFPTVIGNQIVCLQNLKTKLPGDVATLPLVAGGGDEGALQRVGHAGGGLRGGWGGQPRVRWRVGGRGAGGGCRCPAAAQRRRGVRLWSAPASRASRRRGRRTVWG